MTNISSTRGSTPSTTSTGESQSVHTVKRGESLSGIAQQHNVGLDDLLRNNPQIQNPDLIHAGQQVNIPGAPGSSQPASSPPSDAGTPGDPRTYTVKPGDTMTHIAKDHRVTLNQLRDANPQVRNPSLIRPGDTLNLPGAARDPSGGTRTPAPNGGVDPRATMPDPSTVQGTLARGADGPQVRQVQERLSELGYRTGTPDGDFGPMTQGAVRDFQTANGLQTTGAVDNQTRERLFSAEAKPASTIAAGNGDFPRLGRYPPGSEAQRQLFRAAAREAGVPESWASSPGLENLLRSESDGNVGIPNYTYGSRKSDPSQWDDVHAELRSGNITARSSATGLGQLLLANVDRYYPDGRAGIGDPLNEAAGMLSYIKDRYGSPDEAWRRYNTLHEGY